MTTKQKQTSLLQTDLFCGLYNQVKCGDIVSFIDGTCQTPEYPAYKGIVYGKTSDCWNRRCIRVKVTEDNGNVFFEYVSSFSNGNSGIGSYYMGRG